MTLEFFHKDKRGAFGLKRQCKKCCRRYDANYLAKNREKLNQRHKVFDSSPKGIYKKLKSQERAKQNLGRKYLYQHKVLIPQESFVKWYLSQPKICYYCGITEEQLQSIPDAYNNKMKRMSIDRMNSMKPYEEGNLALACLRCNHIKGNFFTASEMVEIGRLFISKKWNNAKQR